MIKHINSTDEFQKQVIENSKNVLVDFFAEWCGPCQMLGPVLEKISNERNDIDIIKVDIDKNMETAIKYGIEVVPTLKFFKNGNIQKSLTGYIPEENLVKEIENL